MKRGNWTDEPCWYVSVVDGGRVALVLGPFQTEEACRRYAYANPADGGDPALHRMMRREAEKRDAWACFYAWGMLRRQNGHSEGVLNGCIEYRSQVTVDAVPA
jgi:hypothetical protein